MLDTTAHYLNDNQTTEVEGHNSYEDVNSWTSDLELRKRKHAHKHPFQSNVEYRFSKDSTAWRAHL